MIAASNNPRSSWRDAVLAAALFIVDMPGIGGVNVRARSGPVREAWLELLRQILPASCPLLRMSPHITDERLLGGIDLAATLRSGRSVAAPGLLAEAGGGVVILSAAERASAALAARIGAVLDTGTAVVHRDGIYDLNPTRIGLVMLDEGIDDEAPPRALLDRIAFHVDLDHVRLGEIADSGVDAKAIIEAHRNLSHVDVGDDMIGGLCEAAAALGIDSIRAPLLAVRAARAAAALAGQNFVRREDVALAAALVLAPRATAIPQAESTPATEPEPETAESGARGNSHHDERNAETQTTDDRPLVDMVIAAARAAMPEGLLTQLRHDDARLARKSAAGRSGALIASLRRGRPAGVRRGRPQAGARLNVVETLRAAAPWQVLRRREVSQRPSGGVQSRRVDIRRDDFRITRLEQRSETISIFAVDASGSSALHRLAEAKGAVEQLLADCYIRRDRVALIAFRGRTAELVLPPTRSLARAKRSLAGLSGGGSTPLALAIDAAATLALAAQRRGQSPVIVLLTDGRANVDRAGAPGREKAAADARDAARAVHFAAIATLVVDISPQPHASAEQLAKELGAFYLPLPYSDAKMLAQAVQTASG